MNHVTAVISMLHEGAESNSAQRIFRGEPVLGWTLQRVRMSQQVNSIAIICWEDQLEHVTPLAAESDAHILSKSPRITLANVAAVSAARRWADGWRGGLLSTCDFDLGFHGPYVKEVAERLTSDAIVLIDASAGLVDPKIIDGLVSHARSRDSVELCFTQSPPGLGGVLLRPALVERLAAANVHPGRLLHYLPEQPMRDPISGDGCAPVPTIVARSTRRFRLDSERQVHRLTEAAIDLNGQLMTSDAEDLLNRLRWTPEIDPMPREVVVEINTTRATLPIYRPRVDRPAMSSDVFRRIIEQLSGTDDLRLTLAGVGDPLLHERVFEFLAMARGAGLRAIHLETDLLPESSRVIDALVDTGIDVLSVHVPAMAQATYRAVMGVDRFVQVIENVKNFVSTRLHRRSLLPILVPTFVKCQQNLPEMEIWYDQWLKAVGAASIVGPSDFCGSIDDVSVADMSPPQRKPCARLWSRMTILSDGRVVSCEQDVTSKQVMGDVSSQTTEQIWRDGFASMRASHKKGCFSNAPGCAACREWHRP
jgi:radical SAM protein with 4Fe4S-binding SPASM domain